MTFLQQLSRLVKPVYCPQALESGGLQPGKGRVLVHAGAGGVGHFAIQLAKAHWKAFVVTTGSTKNQEFLKVHLNLHMSTRVSHNIWLLNQE